MLQTFATKIDFALSTPHPFVLKFFSTVKSGIELVSSDAVNQISRRETIKSIIVGDFLDNFLSVPLRAPASSALTSTFQNDTPHKTR